MKLKLALLTLASLSTGLVLTSCTMKQTAGVRGSGQSKLMDDTFAGKNACNPEDHDRPFIIEWDATDRSSFESLAANDVVIVKYEGCSLKVLDECRNDSIRGSQGSYKPPEWTSGALETIDIHNEGELYAKLPLGEGSLGGRVAGGESFHMEYFVAGTVYSTRDYVWENDIKDVYGCEEATHFVYAYNLGAFALASNNELETSVGGSYFGFGAGGGHSEGSSAEKKGGDLALCSSDAATEISECKSPIRLNLRKIRPGDNPEAQAMANPDDAASLTAAAMINQKMEMSDEARARYDAASQKMNARDGNGCLKELDAHDALDPQNKSSDPKTSLAFLRSQCVMLSGKCDAGKGLLRKTFENHNTANLGPEQIDNQVEGMATMWCQGDSMSKRDQLLQALTQLQNAAYMKTESSEYCTERWKKVNKLKGKVKPKDEYDTRVKDVDRTLYALVPKCFERAGDCKKAREAYEQTLPKETKENFAKLEPDVRADVMSKGFESLVQKCAGKT